MIEKIRNRYKRFRRSESWATFLGVLWALVVFELIRAGVSWLV